MPLLVVLNETGDTDEFRAALVPADIARITELGLEVAVEKGLGLGFGVPDADYRQAGAAVEADRKSLLARADVVFRLQAPAADEAARLRTGALHLSMLDPFNAPEQVMSLNRAGATAISMNMIPRITRAQSMDALTSQANLAGYSAVIQAAALMKRAFPMMMTAAGTIQPVRAFIIGVGVAGLQAIAMARRLGARVEAFDTRPVVAEQVRSLGARFVEVDLGETGETAGGYARELTAEQLEKQRREMAKVCARSDLVITAAQVFGRRAPVIVTADILDQMRPGTVIVDTAIETGGNVEGAQPGQMVERGGVRILGMRNLPAKVAAHASQVYSANLCHLLAEVWDKDRGFVPDPQNEIQAGCVLTHGGDIVQPAVQKAVQAHRPQTQAAEPAASAQASAASARAAVKKRGAKAKASGGKAGKSPHRSKGGKHGN